MPKAPEPKEIRERYSDYENDWADIREEARIDMRFVGGDAWDPADRKAREDNHRPCISPDEIGQYLNQYVNNLRQNKRAIQVNPKSASASTDDAERRSEIIRGIEYKSNAQAAYITAGERAAEASYGFARLITQHSSDKSFDQEIRIKRIANSDTVLINPDYKEADASDMNDGFITDLMRKDDFKRKYKGAKIEGFVGSNDASFEKWIMENYVQIAEFWMLHKTAGMLYLLDTPEGPTVINDDEFKKTGIDKSKILKKRSIEKKEVVQYITNGVEILDETPWKGTYIPILACFGKEIYVDDGGGAKRRLLSMTRLARDPQMLFAYLTTQQCEEAGMTPKAPFMGYKGQFESAHDEWKALNKIPLAYIEVDPIVDGATNQVLPLPVRPAFQPNFQAYEVAKESARRSIQAAMGITPLPTAAQRQNEKSGVALDKIQSQESIGSFHFADNYHRFIENAGRQINELIGPIYDTARDVPTTNAKGEHAILRINDPDYQQANPDKPHLNTQSGEFSETISDGPSYKSQREEASDFVDLIVQNLKNLPIPPPIGQKILAIAIKIKEIGPMGKEISDLLDPQEGDPQQIQAQLQHTMQQAQQMHAYAQALEGELQKLQQEKQAKIVDNQFRMEIEKLKIDASVTIAEINTKAQALQTRMKYEQDIWMQLHGQAHDIASQKDQQGHDADQAQQAQQAQADQQGQAQAHEADQNTQAQQAAAEQAQQQPQGAD